MTDRKPKCHLVTDKSSPLPPVEEIPGVQVPADALDKCVKALRNGVPRKHAFVLAGLNHDNSGLFAIEHAAQLDAAEAARAEWLADRATAKLSEDDATYEQITKAQDREFPGDFAPVDADPSRPPPGQPPATANHLHYYAAAALPADATVEERKTALRRELALLEAQLPPLPPLTEGDDDVK